MSRIDGLPPLREVIATHGLAAKVSEEAADAMELLDITSFYGRMQLLIIAVGIAPVVEEWLFRGVVLQGLVGHLGRARGIALTALLYAPLHPFSVSAGSAFLSAVVASACLGVVLGIVRLGTGSILAPILLAAGINASVVLALWFEDSVSIPGFNAEGQHMPVEILLPAVLVTGFALRPFARLAQEAPRVPEPPTTEDGAEDGARTDDDREPE